MIEGPMLYAFASAVFTGGIAFGGFKVALNGTKGRLDSLEQKEDDAVEERIKVHERLASIETKIDTLVNRI